MVRDTHKRRDVRVVLARGTATCAMIHRAVEIEMPHKKAAPQVMNAEISVRRLSLDARFCRDGMKDCNERQLETSGEDSGCIMLQCSRDLENRDRLHRRDTRGLHT